MNVNYRKIIQKYDELETENQVVKQGSESPLKSA